MGKMRSGDKTSGLEGGGVEKIEECSKKGGINRNEVSMCIRRVESITSLKAGITKEDALHGLSGKFILARSEYEDKTSAHENTRRETEKRLIIKRRK